MPSWIAAAITAVSILVSKLWGGGSSAATPGDQKALDSSSVVAADKRMAQAGAGPHGDTPTNESLGDGSF